MSVSHREDRFQSGEGQIIPRQTKAKQAIVPAELPDPYVVTGEMLVQARCERMTGQPVEGCPADNRKSRISEHAIKRLCLKTEPDTHVVGPGKIAQSNIADKQRRAGNGPGPERFGEASGDFLRGNQETEAQACKAEELSERSQNHHWAIPAMTDDGSIGRYIHEGLVDDQPATTAASFNRSLAQEFGRKQATIRIVRVDDDKVGLRTPLLKRGNVLNEGTRFLKRTRMLVIGWAENGGTALWRKPRNPLDQGLRAGGSDDIQFRGDTISQSGCIENAGEVLPRWQAFPVLQRQIRQWIGMRIDPRREIEPSTALAPKQRHSFRQITTMQHAVCMPLLQRSRQSLVAFMALFCTSALVAAQAAPPARVISLNMCTDQLLLDLADAGQIAGLSPFATDSARSYMADRAGSVPILSGTAEEVMVLKPDLVVSGTFTKRATREFIRARGVKLEEFAPVRSFAETKRQIQRFGEISGGQARAATRISDIESAMIELQRAASHQKLRVLPLSRRAWVSGANSLMSELLQQVGLVNAAGELGIRTGGRTTLEQIVMLRPDAILISRDDEKAEDQGQALLLHPAIQALFPPERRIVVPESLTVCGGPMLADAMRTIAKQVSRLKPRDADPR